MLAVSQRNLWGGSMRSEGAAVASGFGEAFVPTQADSHAEPDRERTQPVVMAGMLHEIFASEAVPRSLKKNPDGSVDLDEFKKNYLDPLWEQMRRDCGDHLDN